MKLNMCIMPPRCTVVLGMYYNINIVFFLHISQDIIYVLLTNQFKLIMDFIILLLLNEFRVDIQY